MITNPTRVVPNKTINAPGAVIKVAVPPHASLPKTPLLPKVATEIKNKMLPITTFGCPKGFLTFETSKAQVRKIKGRNSVDHANILQRKSLISINIDPLLENEIKTKAAREKKIT